MKLNSLQKLAAAAAITLLASPLAQAGQANGNYTNAFLSSVLPLWDISGAYTGSYTGTKASIQYTFDLTNSPSGDIVGTGTTVIDYDGYTLDGDTTVVGKVEGTDTAPRVLAVFASTITTPVSAKATVKLDYEIEGSDGVLLVTGGSASLEATLGKKRKTYTESAPKGGTVTLPTDVTGDWILDLTLTPNGEKYTGSATVTTSTGATVDFIVTGTYDSKTDTSELELKSARGELTLGVSTSGSTLTVNKLKGKLFGQNLNYKAS
jgi:hypothetical protein